MDFSETPPNSPLAGCFLVQTAGTRAIGLSADEVAALLDSPEGGAAEIFRIHRVFAGDRMELVGVSADAFTRQSSYLFFRPTVAEARADYDALEALAARVPPPCRMELCLARARGLQPEHVVALIFRAAGEESVGQWLNACDPPPGSSVDAGPAALDAYRAAAAQVVRQVVLESK